MPSDDSLQFLATKGTHHVGALFIGSLSIRRKDLADRIIPFFTEMTTVTFRDLPPACDRALH